MSEALPRWHSEMLRRVSHVQESSSCSSLVVSPSRRCCRLRYAASSNMCSRSSSRTKSALPSLEVSQGHPKVIVTILGISPLEAAFYIDFYPLDVKLVKEKFGRRNHYFDFRLETWTWCVAFSECEYLLVSENLIIRCLFIRFTKVELWNFSERWLSNQPDQASRAHLARTVTNRILECLVVLEYSRI